MGATRAKEHCSDRDGRCRAQCPDGCEGPTETHEEPPRSLGGDPLDVRDAMNLCRKAHDRRHGKSARPGEWGILMRIRKVSLIGAEGPIEFEWKGHTLANVDVPAGIFGYRKATPSADEQAAAFRATSSARLRSVSWGAPKYVRAQRRNQAIAAAFDHATQIVGRRLSPVDVAALGRMRTLWPAARQIGGCRLIDLSAHPARDIGHALQYGPVIVGSSWTRGMLDTDRDGLVSSDGAVVGQHAYCLMAYSAEREQFRGINSRGVGWGQVGRFWLPYSDLDALAKLGQACVVLAVEQE